ncbi:MAG TPA: peptidoglycan DD-metalloendopeptidase family protein [Chitinispirillaceae bacterium]|nr:peptidoglycan DD-metalloendopeptidase family protein [Chitinispirillaceae bacterium]
MKIFLFVAVCFCSAAGTDNLINNYDQEIKQKSGVMDSIKNELEKGRLRLSGLQKEEGSYLEQIEQIEQNINASRTYLKLLELRIDTVGSVISLLQDSLNKAQNTLVERQSIMKRRIRQAYMTGSPDPLLLILAAKNPLELLHRVRYIEELNRYDQDLVKNIELSRKDIDNKKMENQKEHNRLEDLLNAKKNEQVSLQKEEVLRKNMLEKVRLEKNAFQAMIAELEFSQNQLQKIIEQLEKKRKQAKDQKISKGVLTFEKRKGKLGWPVKGTIVNGFGKIVHPVYKTVIMNSGVDISAKQGQQVQCVAPGAVIHVGSMRGLGRMVIIDHAAGYMTVYAQLEQISVNLDQKVQIGTILGKLGSSSNGSKLHFEIRKATDPLDPSEWLEK